MSSMIFLSNMGAEWYFQGMEDQVYITIRYIIVRIIALVLLFYIVEDTTDSLNYAIIVILTVCGSNFFNFFYIFKTINISGIRLEDLNFKRHIKPVLTIFIASISINIYLLLDNFLIGSIAGDSYVGYYSVSNKLIRVVISFIVIIGSVLLPRLSNLYLTNRLQYYQYLRITFTIILVISIPFSVVFIAFAKNIIMIIGGTNFIPSILTMQILSPLCIVVGIAYFIGYLVLYPQNKEKIYTKAVLISAVISLVLNLFMISKFKQNGAAIVAVLTEILAVLIMIFFAKNEIAKIQLFNFNFIKIIVSAIIMIIITFIISFFSNLTNLFFFIVAIFLSVLSFLIPLYLLREETALFVQKFIFQIFWKNSSSNK